MTGERYQCQDCEEILVMPIEFDNTEDYLEFLKVQSPERFAQIDGVLKSTEKKPEETKYAPQDVTFELSPNNGKLSHVCIFESCQKGKKGGTDYCRKHRRDGNDTEL